MTKKRFVIALGLGLSFLSAGAVNAQIPVAASQTEDAPLAPKPRPASTLADSTEHVERRTIEAPKPTKQVPAEAKSNTKEPVGALREVEASSHKATSANESRESSGSDIKPKTEANQNILQQVNMPEVPAQVLPKSAVNRPSYTDSAQINDKSVLKMEPGVNQIVPIAVNHLNRIVTPFSNPVVTTMSDSATTEIAQNIVYIGTNDDLPVTAFITEHGDQSHAMSLTLVPQRIPPRELFLQLSNSYGFGAASMSNPEAKRWETSQPYVETIRDVFRQVALGELPQGYSINRVTTHTDTPFCNQSGLNFDFRSGQVLAGHSLTVLIGVVTNTSSQAIEFQEASCGDWDVAAVAAWPNSVLNPRQKSEVYIAKKVNTAKPQTSKRPSLLGR